MSVSLKETQQISFDLLEIIALNNIISELILRACNRLK
tara:strand:+ start:87496 stop:87609 length:114 start_codon:yes stop_codon:yes gene_type:complete